VANDITRVTPASFEPTIDYVVTKIPRFAFEKFPGAEAVLSTAMKSVGEVMAIGRCFAESLQKALQSMETGLTGLNSVKVEGATPDTLDPMRSALAVRSPDRLLKAAEALRLGMSVSEICRITGFDPWFIREINTLVKTEFALTQHGLPQDADAMLHLKQLGFGDARIAELTGQSAQAVTNLRHALGVEAIFKRVDTCAAEFASPTPYLYSTYEATAITPAGSPALQSCEAYPSERQKIVILGGGPNRIGQGIEFDYCCVHASYALRDGASVARASSSHALESYETIMVNCNPETVSTDYDTSDRLYF